MLALRWFRGLLLLPHTGSGRFIPVVPGMYRRPLGASPVSLRPAPLAVCERQTVAESGPALVFGLVHLAVWLANYWLAAWVGDREAR